MYSHLNLKTTRKNQTAPKADLKSGVTDIVMCQLKLFNLRTAEDKQLRGKQNVKTLRKNSER